jgi:hypothetical protein
VNSFLGAFVHPREAWVQRIPEVPPPVELAHRAHRSRIPRPEGLPGPRSPSPERHGAWEH